MRFMRSILICTFAFSILLLGVAGHARSMQSRVPTILDGVYTTAQATRGEAEYAANCAKCHEGECPEGSPLGTPLFIERWREENLSFLFTFMKTRMPAKAEGTLAEPVYLDILAYLLQKNEYPAGSGELTLPRLEAVRFVGKDGPKPLPTNALIQVVGCLSNDPVNGWMLNTATDPARALEGGSATAKELADARAKARGALRYEIQFDEFRPGFKPEPFAGHKIYVKGAFIRQNTGTHRVIVTFMESLAARCTP